MDEMKAPAAAGEGRGDSPLFVKEYMYSDELASRLARLQASGRSRGILLVCGLFLVFLGAVWVFTPQRFHWFGLVPIAMGLVFLWRRSNLYRAGAKRARERLREEEPSEGRYRLVEVTDSALTLSLADGRSQVYPLDELTDFQMDGALFAVVFGRNGIVVPKRTFTKGDADSFGTFLTAKLYPAGAQGPDTPNRSAI